MISADATAILDTTSDFFKLGYSDRKIVTRPPNAFFTQYIYDLNYGNNVLDGAFVPMVFGFYIDSQGYQLPAADVFDTVSNPFGLTDDAQAAVYADGSHVYIGVFGKFSDPNEYTLIVDYYVLINSLLEAGNA